MIDPPPLSEFQSAELTFQGRTCTVRYLGGEGAGVVLMHEIPGMTPNVLRLAKLLALRGFALSLTVDANGKVQAAVMSEPSLPFPFPFTQEELSDAQGHPTWVAFERLVDFLRMNLGGGGVGAR